jgi:hypothetical protein
LCCEIVLTVCTERRLKRNRFLFYSHHPPQGSSSPLTANARA